MRIPSRTKTSITTLNCEFVQCLGWGTSSTSRTGGFKRLMTVRVPLLFLHCMHSDELTPLLPSCSIHIYCVYHYCCSTASPLPPSNTTKSVRSCQPVSFSYLTLHCRAGSSLDQEKSYRNHMNYGTPLLNAGSSLSISYLAYHGHSRSCPTSKVSS